MIKLPEGPRKGDKNAVNSLLILSRPKVGKTSMLMSLPNSILIDLEGGASHYDGNCIDVNAESIKEKKGPISTLFDIRDLIQTANREKGGFVYDFGIIDTITKLEEYCEKYANAQYKKSSVGQSFTGKNILTELEYGAGYLWLRNAVNEVLNPFYNLFKTLIIVGHVKDGSINIAGKSLSVADINLTGKIKQIVTGKCDAIGTLYRSEENPTENYLNFITSPTDIVTGARPVHLSGKEFLISTYDNEVLTTHWNKIFTDI